MVNVLKDAKWLINYMVSIVMYAIIVILILVGIVLLTYFIDFKIRDNNAKTPLYGAYVIVSGSMEPLIKVRDAVIVRRAIEEDIKIGDVVTYRSTDPAFNGVLITHRVVSIDEKNGERVFVTKGDHNETIDRTPVSFSQIQGKVVMRVPKIGYIKYFLVDYYGWILAVVIPSIGVIVYDVIKLFKNVKEKGENRKNKERVMAFEK